MSAQGCRAPSPPLMEWSFPMLSATLRGRSTGLDMMHLSKAWEAAAVSTGSESMPVYVGDVCSWLLNCKDLDPAL